MELVRSLLGLEDLPDVCGFVPKDGGIASVLYVISGLATFF